MDQKRELCCCYNCTYLQRTYVCTYLVCRAGKTVHMTKGLHSCCGQLSHFQIIQGLLDRTMQLLEVPLSISEGDDGYHLKASDGEWRGEECMEGCVVMYLW